MVSFGIFSPRIAGSVRAVAYARGIAQGKRERFVGIAAEGLKASLDAIAAREAAIAAALAQAGYPEPRTSAPGYQTLLRAIVGQQVSIRAAASMWAKLTAAVGDPPDPERLLEASDGALRAAGLSRQKASYARSLAEEVVSGRLDFARLPADDEEAIAELVRVNGIGRWTAEIYLLFAEGRPDVWPAGDLAVQIEIGRILGLPSRPTEKALRLLAEAWRPHRGALAVFAWHHRKVVPL
jgi:DNA-3-methyladenine glycosylase II